MIFKNGKIKEGIDQILAEIPFYLWREEFGQLAHRLKHSPEAINRMVFYFHCAFWGALTHSLCVFSHRAVPPPLMPHTMSSVRLVASFFMSPARIETGKTVTEAHLIVAC